MAPMNTSTSRSISPISKSKIARVIAARHREIPLRKVRPSKRKTSAFAISSGLSPMKDLGSAMRAARVCPVLAIGLCGAFSAADAKTCQTTQRCGDKTGPNSLQSKVWRRAKAGQFAEAVQSFVDGFQVSPLPSGLFHLAQVAAAEKAGRSARSAAPLSR